MASPNLPGRALDASIWKGANVYSGQVQNGFPHRGDPFVLLRISLDHPWFHIIKPVQQNQGCFLPPRWVFIKWGAFGASGTNSLTDGICKRFFFFITLEMRAYGKVPELRPLKIVLKANDLTSISLHKQISPLRGVWHFPHVSCVLQPFWERLDNVSKTIKMWVFFDVGILPLGICPKKKWLGKKGKIYAQYCSS